MQQTIYIIGGKYRRKKITFPDITNLRPTTNRIRETIFNWLMHDIRDAICLDGYAGSGALGFEAISRGARCVTLIENNLEVYQALKKSAATFNEENIELIKSDLEIYLSKTTKKFDIIFLDPPFNQPFPEKCISLITNNNILSPEGLLYIEYNSAIELNPKIWQNIKIKTTGQVTYALYKKLNYS